VRDEEDILVVIVDLPDIERSVPWLRAGGVCGEEVRERQGDLLLDGSPPCCQGSEYP